MSQVAPYLKAVYNAKILITAIAGQESMIAVIILEHCILYVFSLLQP